MIYLVDTNVLSEPTKPAPIGKVIDWLNANERQIVVDAVVLGELHFGILILPRGRKRAQLERWFEQVAQTIKCLPWDSVTSRRWAALVADLRRRGETIPVLDGMIAATALQHGLTVVTRDARDFRKAGVKVLDPFG